jgi:hypothetical protein
MKTGVCRGGPMDGVEIISRYPKGVLVVDRPNNLAWLYEWRRGEFVIREDYENGHTLEYEGRIRAANEPDYDVIALP